MNNTFPTEGNLSGLSRKDFQKEINNKETDLFILKNKKGMEVAVTNYGCAILAIMVPDKDGKYANVVLGHDSIDHVVNSPEPFLSTTIGRYGNRIAKGKFTLYGEEHELTINNGPNSLHGGPTGFHARVWDADQLAENIIQFNYVSADGEEGFPGNLEVEMVYRLEEEENALVKKSLAGETLTEEELKQYRTMCMLFLGAEYKKRNWVMQLHYGAKRENNELVFKSAGANAGIDCINPKGFVAEVADFMNALNREGNLPKTIIYSLNPTDNALIGTMIGCFQGEGVRGTIQQGAAWWFKDHKSGMEEHMKSLASLSLLGNFVGMLTDSRSFISYPRHEYFRRILCNYIGNLVENGEYPEDYDLLGEIVKNISYYNAVNYFGFDLK